MKIITQGALPQEKTYKAQCRNCQTVFEFQRHEARYVPDQRDGDFMSVKCPLLGCHREVTVAA